MNLNEAQVRHLLEQLNNGEAEEARLELSAALAAYEAAQRPQPWERGEFHGLVAVDDKRSIQAPNGLVMPDDASQAFETAWQWCAVPLPPGTHYGHAWNDAPTSLADLAIPFIDDPRATNRTRHAGATFEEWSKSAELVGDEDDFAKREAWKFGQRKPTHQRERRARAAERVNK